MKKKIFAIAAALTLAATTLSTTVMASEAAQATSEAAAEEGGFPSWIIMILIYAAVIGGAYFLLFRPQSKKKKKEAALRRNAQIGDMITTIGGISGRIIAVKEDTDTIIMETGTDRNKIALKRWAISSVDSPVSAPVTDTNKSAATSTKELKESKEKKGE